MVLLGLAGGATLGSRALPEINAIAVKTNISQFFILVTFISALKLLKISDLNFMGFNSKERQAGCGMAKKSLA